MSGIPITVRDARAGRDPNLQDGGEILTAYQATRPLDIGERLTLPDGSLVLVVGFSIEAGLQGTGVTQTVHVGDV